MKRSVSMGDPVTFDIERLEERVRAAARQLPAPEGSEFRRLETRRREEYDPGSGWMIPLKKGNRDVYAVELVRCDPDAPGAVLIQQNSSDLAVRTAAQAMYEMWIEELPAGAL